MKFINRKPIISSLLFIFSLFLMFFYSPKLALADTIPYQITNTIPRYWAPSYGATFFTTNLTVNYQSGDIILSGLPDGTGENWVDDAIEITVTHPNGTTSKYTHEYQISCIYVQKQGPQNITNFFQPGENQVSIRLYDICGGYVSSSSLYLVNTNAPKPPSSTHNTLFSDDFNDGNFDGWRVYSGTWSAKDNNLWGVVQGGNKPGSIFAGDVGWDNYTVEFDVNNIDGVDDGVGIRMNLNGEGYKVNLRHGTGQYATPSVYLWKSQGGGSAPVAYYNEFSFPFINQQWYHIKVQAIDNNIRVFINDLLIIDFVDHGAINGPFIKQGGITLDTWTGNIGFSSVRFDNINVYSDSITLSKTPVIFIPGIGGSEFKTKNEINWSANDGHGGTYSHTYPTGEKVWVNEPEARALGDDDYFDVLRLRNDGQTEAAALELNQTMFDGSYDQIIPFFELNGYQSNKDLFIFNYDWRKDLSLTTPQLDQTIEEIKQKTGQQKVDIVAHSMGGLVARNYISNQERATNVRKLITLGTPHLGTPFFLKVLMYGDCLTDPRLKDFLLCLGVNSLETKDIIQNMITGYELAPTQKYYEFYNGADGQHPLSFVDNRDIDSNGITGFLNYQQLKTTLANLYYNTSLFKPAETFHNLDNNFTNSNGVDISIISGSGNATTGQIIEDYTFDFGGIKIPKIDIRKINGDDTVPLFSASLTDGLKSIAGTTNIYYTDQRHSNLVFNGPALNLVKNILAGDSTNISGVSNHPYLFSGNAISVHSPVLIHAYDSSGNHTGSLTNGDYEAKIPGSSYEVLNDAKFIWLPDDGVYTVKFDATDQGSFDFKIRNYKDDANNQTILYKDVPLTINTKAETVFDTSSTQPPILQVDEDGNGSVDANVEKFSILTGEANYDYTPPTISFEVSPKVIWPPNNKMVDINITGNINDEHPYQVKILVGDEYDLIEPSFTIQNQTNIDKTIQLEASRKGDDKDGRKYIVKILATDLAGNTTLATQEVIVPHDQRN